MRLTFSAVLLALLVSGCGDDDGTEPEEPFPLVAGVYEVEGTFDDLPASEASFEGTLELTQASQESGALEGSISILARLGDELFDVSDDALASATVSPTGVIAFTAGGAGATWTFSGTASDNSIIDGRHTLGDGTESVSGPWRADPVGSIPDIRMATSNLGDLLHQLRARALE